MIENWPTKKYNIIYADPPWDLGKGGDDKWGSMQNGMAIKSHHRKKQIE